MTQPSRCVATVVFGSFVEQPRHLVAGVVAKALVGNHAADSLVVAEKGGVVVRVIDDLVGISLQRDHDVQPVTVVGCLRESVNHPRRMRPGAML